jgi:chemotaxis methyl-accepting protein methylase
MQRLESWLEAQLGLQLDRAMRHRLHQLVAEVAAERHMDLGGCAELLSRDDSARQALVNRLVVPTTAFFRHPEQFDALRVQLADWPDPVTIWSAGCSTGAEPYTIAMLLDESGRRRWRVVASDLSTTALEWAAAGLYGDTQVTGLSVQRRQRFLELARGRWRVAASLRERVLFVRHNLATDDVPQAARPSQAVFCRNVMIYLRPAVQRAFLDRLDDQVPALEVLFLGATESLWGVTERFQPVRAQGAYAYRPARRLTAARARPEVPSSPRARPASTVPPARSAGLTPVPAVTPKGALDASVYMADGKAALAAGQPAAAAAAFRRAAYLDADDPVARISLALALDAAGHSEAGRAFVAARAALERRGLALDDSEVPGLSGLRGTDLVRMIEHRLRQLA